MKMPMLKNRFAKGEREREEKTSLKINSYQ